MSDPTGGNGNPKYPAQLVLTLQSPPRPAGVAQQLLYYSWLSPAGAYDDGGIILPESGRHEMTIREGFDVEVEVASITDDGDEVPGPTLAFTAGRLPVKSAPGAVSVVAWREKDDGLTARAAHT